MDRAVPCGMLSPPASAGRAVASSGRLGVVVMTPAWLPHWLGQKGHSWLELIGPICRRGPRLDGWTSSSPPTRPATGRRPSTASCSTPSSTAGSPPVSGCHPVASWPPALGVARGTVTTAYDRLTAEGFLVSRVGAGTFVCAGGRAAAGPPGAGRRRPAAGRVVGAAGPGARRGTDRVRPLGRRARHHALPPRRVAPARVRDPAAVAARRLRLRGRRPPGAAGRGREVCRPGEVGGRQPRGRAAHQRRPAGPRRGRPGGARPGRRRRGRGPGLHGGGAGCSPRTAPRCGRCGSTPRGSSSTTCPSTARMVYVTPSHQFPTGAVMSLRRRIALLEWASRRNVVIVEDDYDSEFRFEDRPLAPLQNLDRDGRVVYVGSFSKTLMPSLRVGYLIAPRSLQDTLRQAKLLTDWQGDAVTQGALARFMGEGLLSAHVRKVTKLYAGAQAGPARRPGHPAARGARGAALVGRPARVHLLHRPHRRRRGRGCGRGPGRGRPRTRVGAVPGHHGRGRASRWGSAGSPSSRCRRRWPGWRRCSRPPVRPRRRARGARRSGSTGPRRGRSACPRRRPARRRAPRRGRGR